MNATTLDSVHDLLIDFQKTFEEHLQARDAAALMNAEESIFRSVLQLADTLFRLVLESVLVDVDCPPGTSVVSMTFLCGYAPFKPFEADYFSGKKEGYKQEKERLVRILILIQRTQARLIPSLSRMIEVMEVSTPLTNARDTGKRRRRSVRI